MQTLRHRSLAVLLATDPWQKAALARDLPLLVNITVLVTLVTLLANTAADLIGSMFRSQQA